MGRVGMGGMGCERGVKGAKNVVVFFTLVFVISASTILALEPFRIDIVEEGSGWPVPLVELRTTHSVRFVSDNAGVIAFDLPELMHRETWFDIEGHGYGVAKDGFGYSGVRLTPQPGKTAVVKVKRQLPGKRLGRLTGGGLFAESQRCGLHSSWREQGILGCDTIQITQHNNQLYWAWGDTTVAKYPLGLFHMIGATTPLKPLTSFEPPVALRYNYFGATPDEPKVIARMPGEGPTWISGFASLPDAEGNNRLVATYEKIKGFLTPYETGLCLWHEEKKQFEQLKVLWKKDGGTDKPPLAPDGHPARWKDGAGKEWILFGDPFPRLQCEASFEAWQNPDSWQRLEAQKSVPAADGSAQIEPHRGSIAWNAYRQQWVAVFTQYIGTPSFLGEIWYAEAEQPIGPWTNAVKVVTHNKYTFYNPHLHQDFTEEGSPILLFEGTYTKEFSGTQEATPRYNYNQILYRIDLDEQAFKFK